MTNQILPHVEEAARATSELVRSRQAMRDDDTECELDTRAASRDRNGSARSSLAEALPDPTRHAGPTLNGS